MTLGLVHLSIACDEFIQFAIRNNETSIKTPTMNEFQIIMNKIQLTPINCVILLRVPLVPKKNLLCRSRERFAEDIHRKIEMQFLDN